MSGGLGALLGRLPRLSPAVRIGMGLASLVVALLLVIDIVFGVFPNPAAALAEQRARLAEQIAMQTAIMLETGQESSLPRTVALVMAREEQLARIRIERADGTSVIDRRSSGLSPGEAIAIDRAYVMPLVARDSQWGRVAIWYRDPGRTVGRLLLESPLVLMIVGIGSVCFVAFALYLRRILSHLDPASVVPDRIRQAFDVFSSGIVVIDRGGAILLANDRFATLLGLLPDRSLTGQRLDRLPGFSDALNGPAASYPWTLAMDTRESLTGARLDLHASDGSRRRLLVNSAPIDDGDGRVRGCLISFEDITPIIELNEQLERSNEDLRRSKQDIEQMNVELQRLATRDSLTGAFTRRALFERLEALIAQSRAAGRPLCCIMTDIDHFKRFNDEHGHAAGDAVLRAISHVFANELREEDVLARYGGEEFCIVLPGVDLATAYAIAERLRAAAESTAGTSIREPRGLRITASFGLSALTADILGADQLIDEADRALYAAKEAGRNRVVVADLVPGANSSDCLR